MFLDEEAFEFIEPIFVRLCPEYDHYAFTEIGRPLWSDILKAVDVLSEALDGESFDETSLSCVGFSADERRRFLESSTTSLVELRQMLLELTSWIRLQLKEQNVVSVLGL